VRKRSVGIKKNPSLRERAHGQGTGTAGEKKVKLRVRGGKKKGGDTLKVKKGWRQRKVVELRFKRARTRKPKLLRSEGQGG